jgi:hypothetical protein
MGTLLEPSFVFFSFFLFVAPSPSSCIAQRKKKLKKKSKFSVTTHCDTASYREGWVA